MATTAQKPKQVVGSDHSTAERAAELSEQVLEQVKEGQEAAIEACASSPAPSTRRCRRVARVRRGARK